MHTSINKRLTAAARRRDLRATRVVCRAHRLCDVNGGKCTFVVMYVHCEWNEMSQEMQFSTGGSRCLSVTDLLKF